MQGERSKVQNRHWVSSPLIIVVCVLSGRMLVAMQSLLRHGIVMHQHTEGTQQQERAMEQVLAMTALMVEEYRSCAVVCQDLR
jgi:hypothetical protein